MGNNDFIFMFHPGGGWLFKFGPATPPQSVRYFYLSCVTSPYVLVPNTLT